jgi:ectoine hydroxylase-related dioxygenase (phytanoyl-CoA dioxygenase family)
MIPSEEHKNFFKKEGYLVVKNIVPQEKIDMLYRSMVAVFQKYHPHEQEDFLRGVSWENTHFHQRMAEFRKQDPRVFSALYDSMQTTVALWNFVTDPILAGIAAALMDEDIAGLTTTDALLRMDASGDTRNKLAWHQDSAHFRQNAKGAHGVVCAVTLRDLTADLGPLEIVPRSHTLGTIAIEGSVKDEERYNSLYSQQYAIPEEDIKGFERESLIASRGDAYFINFDLVHCSGANTSGMFRFTVICRYHKMLANDFVPGRLIYYPTKKS